MSSNQTGFKQVGRQAMQVRRPSVIRRQAPVLVVLQQSGLFG